MRQRRWLELIKDYNLEVHYHLGKANVVADALSQKSHCNTLEALSEDGFNLLQPVVLHNITISTTCGATQNHRTTEDGCRCVSHQEKDERIEDKTF